MALRGNFLGAAIVVIMYTIYMLFNVSAFSHTLLTIFLVILNALLIILMYFAFKDFNKPRR